MKLVFEVWMVTQSKWAQTAFVGEGCGGGAGEERVEDEGGVGGQENEIFAHTINLIIKKLKEIHRRVIDRLISSRSVWSFWLWATVRPDMKTW